MDLDNLKKIWNQTQVDLPPVSDDKMLSILRGKGKTALSKLYIWELTGAVVFLVLILVPCIYNQVLIIFSKSVLAMYFLISFCIFGFLWQLFKIWILRRVNLQKNSVLVSAKHICTYRLCINAEVFISILFVFVFMILYFYPWLGSMPDSKPILLYVIIVSWIVVVALLIWLIYVRFYRKQIRKIEESIIEIEDFEKDNL